MIDLQELNEAQRAAVTCIDAPSLVIAGAGSGKTRVLTYKIAYLLDQGYKPWNVLALTFTNKAAREMQQRIARQVGPELAGQLWMGTFHSIFSRILRIEAASLGFTSNFTIYDASDSRSLVKTILRELNLDEKVYKPATVCNRISEAKNGLVFPDQYRNDASLQNRDYQSKMPAIGEIYLRYMQRCRLSNAMDFDDLLLYTFYLFDHNPEILAKYQERFHFVLVDEYQDTNYAQHRIVWQLTQQRQRVSVVGDDAQSIYSFRGANIDNILKFQNMYQGACLFKLERNYRSTQTIVNAANSLIAHNRGQIHKDVYSEKSEGRKIGLFNVQSDYEESIVVSHRIEALHQKDHIPFADMAILYRTNSQSRSLEEQIRKLGIPYRIYGGLSFYQRKEIKDVIAYLRMALNPHDEEALKRIINYPARGIGDTTLNKVLRAASQYGISPWLVISEPQRFQLDVNKGTLTKLENFATQIQRYHADIQTVDAYTLARRIVQESGVAADINHGHEPDDVTRQENLQEMLDSIAGFVQERREEGHGVLLSDYLQEVSLLSDLDDAATSGHETSAAADPEDKVTLMTVHSAKGLEFRVVFVVGLEEELFPNQMALQEGARGLEEERRLMYVAMTRAEEQLYLSTARSRFRFGKTEVSTPSRFLNEIDSHYILSGGGHGGTQRQSPSAQARGGALGDGPSVANQFPPSVWGKTLRRVSSLPPVARTVSPASPAQPPHTSVGSTHSPSGTGSGMPTSSGNRAIQVGSIVQHSRFGRGKVLTLEGSGLDAKATVEFDNVGRKQLLLRFAKIDVIA